MALAPATLPASIILAQVQLPNFISRVVQYVHEDVETHGLLVADGDYALSPLAKLEVLPARSGNGRVHIRCSYNNRFLAIRREGDSVVAPVAEEPVEDESAWGCTMFLPSNIPGFNALSIQLVHVQTGRKLFSDAQNPVLAVSEQVPPIPNIQTASHMIFFFIDLGPLFMMPRNVAFKAENGNHLRFMTINNQPFLQFNSDVDKWHQSVVHEVHGNDIDGSYRIKCHSSNVNDGFWRRNRGSDAQWIHADSVLMVQNSPTSHSWGDSIFSIVKLGESTEGIIVAFRSTGNSNYLRRGSASNVQNVLSATAASIVAEARFMVVELVRSRLVFDVNFNLLDTRIYSNNPEEATRQDFNNITSLPQNMELIFTHTQTRTSTWNATVSTTVGVSTTFRAGVPFIANGEINTSIEFTAAYEWGRSYTVEETREDRISITVPPMSRVTVTRIETQGRCDVPFSYTQEDTLFNWERRVYQKHDGLFRGINSFNIHYLAREEPLPSGSRTQETRTYPVVPHTSRLLSSSEPAAQVPSGSSE